MKVPFVVYWHGVNCYHKVLLLLLLFVCLIKKILSNEQFLKQGAQKCDLL